MSFKNYYFGPPKSAFLVFEEKSPNFVFFMFQLYTHCFPKFSFCFWGIYFSQICKSSVFPSKCFFYSTTRCSTFLQRILQFAKLFEFLNSGNLILITYYFTQEPILQYYYYSTATTNPSPHTVYISLFFIFPPHSKVETLYMTGGLS